MTTPQEWASEPAIPPTPPPPGSAHHHGASRRRRPVPLAVVALIVVLAVVAVVVWRMVQPSNSFTVHGRMVLVGTDNYVPYGDNACAGMDGYDDLKVGADVVVSDGSGKTVAVGSVQASKGEATDCLFTFDIPGVPAGKKFYGVSVSHRGTVQFSEQEIKAGPGLTIGSNG